MRPLEFYIAVLAAAVFVFESNKDKPFWSRFMITISSAGFGFSLAPEVSMYVSVPLTITGLLITALGFLVLEVSVALISDRQFVKEAIIKRLSK
jgi:hypothetical protein